jgi:hypothetical protein
MNHELLTLAPPGLGRVLNPRDRFVAVGAA